MRITNHSPRRTWDIYCSRPRHAFAFMCQSDPINITGKYINF